MKNRELMVAMVSRRAYRATQEFAASMQRVSDLLESDRKDTAERLRAFAHPDEQSPDESSAEAQEPDA